MTIGPGSRVGAYEVSALLGEGGMGRVYVARDTRLGRDVALKVLPPAVANDPERLVRFEREARTLAALNHPNIAHVYGFEQYGDTSAIAMELVTGEDLAARLKRGPLPVIEALRWARQIVEALEFAHGHGVIHRDLKPANIKVRPDGTVKILDFGLAKALEPVAPDPQSSAATMTSPMTMPGVILGTAAYMSPEQARGQVVDQRADIWAFGVVLFEMLTGRLAFAAPTVTDTLARVIEREPDWTALPEGTPPPVRTLLRRCLEKDPARRAPHIGLARLEMDDALTAPVAASGAEMSAVPGGARPSIARLAAVGVLIALVSGAIGYLARPGAPVEADLTYRSELVLDENVTANPPSHRIALSPDGRALAYVGVDPASGQRRLYLRSLDTDRSQGVAGSDGASSPFWSPDSRSVAFFVAGQLKRLDRAAGQITQICAMGDQREAGPGTWGPDGTIVFVNGAVLARVPAAGGTPDPLTTLDGSGETQHSFPWFLPDGRRLLFTSYRGLVPIAVDSFELETSTRARLVEGGTNVQYANGSLLFVRDTSLVAQPFDPSTLALTGSPVVLAESISVNLIVPRAGGFSVSQTGAVAYVPPFDRPVYQLAWRTRDGQTTVIGAEDTPLRSLSLAPDGLRTAIVPIGEQVDLWVMDLRRGVRSRVTHESQPATTVWSSDSRTIYYSAASAGGRLDIYRRSDYGAGAEVLVFASDAHKWLTDVSADGRVLLYETSQNSTADVWAVTLGEPPRALPILNTSFEERFAQFSPDGRWIVYTSNLSGRADVFVARYPDGAHRTQVSASGGDFPRWGDTGRELFFHTSGQVVSVPVTFRDDGVEVGRVTPVFALTAPVGFRRLFYDVGPGGRFLVSVAAAERAESARIMLLTNWPGVAAR